MSEKKTSNNKEYNLTQGPILNRLLLVAIPIMGTQLMQMAYNLTDMFWLGKVGSAAVAASGTAGMYLWLSNGPLMFGRAGSEIGVSQMLGREDEKMAREYSQNSLMLAVFLGILFAALMILFRNPLIGFFGLQEEDVAKDAANYLAITAAAIPATYISGAITGAFNGSGNSKTPFHINFVGLMTNMALDPFFIITLDMGIIGAGVATAFSQILVAALFVIAMKFSKGRPFEKYNLITKPNKKRLHQIFLWSWPVAVESMLFTILSMITSRIIAKWGAAAIAVQRVGNQIESLAWLIGGGFSSAVTAFVGQNFGAGKWTRIRQGIKISTRTMFVWGIIITGIMFFGARFLISLFLHEEELIQLGAVYLRMLSICQIIGCLEYNSAGAFRGIGKTLPPSVSSIGGNAIRVPLVYFLSKTPLGLNGIWIGICVGAIIRSLWTCLWFYFTMRKLPREDRGVSGSFQ